MEELIFDIEIENFGIYNELNGRKNVVYEIRAFYVGKLKRVFDGGESTSEERELFVIHLPTDNLEDFVEYENVTKEVTVEWIKKHSDENLLKSMEDKVVKRLYPNQQYVKPNF